MSKVIPPYQGFDGKTAALTSRKRGCDPNNSDHRKAHRETLAREKFARSIVSIRERELVVDRLGGKMGSGRGEITLSREYRFNGASSKSPLKNPPWSRVDV